MGKTNPAVIKAWLDKFKQEHGVSYSTYRGRLLLSETGTNPSRSWQARNRQKIHGAQRKYRRIYKEKLREIGSSPGKLYRQRCYILHGCSLAKHLSRKWGMSPSSYNKYVRKLKYSLEEAQKILANKKLRPKIEAKCKEFGFSPSSYRKYKNLNFKAIAELVEKNKLKLETGELRTTHFKKKLRKRPENV